MKNRILSLVLIFVLMFACGCQKQSVNNNSDSEELYNYEVTEEPFENMPVMNGFSNHKIYKTEQELFENSEIVIIGMPTETFTEGQVRKYDFDNNEIKEDSDAKAFHSFTVRDIKVLKVIKGNCSEDTIKVADKATVKVDGNNNAYIYGLPDDDSIAKKNVKYIYYLTKSLVNDADFYFAIADQGKVNIDGLDINSMRTVSDTRLNEVKTRYAAEFEKYDRSSELAVK